MDFGEILLSTYYQKASYPPSLIATSAQSPVPVIGTGLRPAPDGTGLRYSNSEAGRPFVAAVDPSSEVATIALQSQCGVVAAPGDADDLARAIAVLHDNPELTRVMGEHARRAAWQFDRRPAVQAYYTLFASLQRLARAA